MRPSCAKIFRPIEGAGNAGCLLHPRSRVQYVQRIRTRAYRYSRSIPAFPAQWFYGLCRALPGDEFVLSPSSANYSSCHRHRRIKGSVAPGWADQNLRRLDTSNGCQDHAVLPYALAPSSCTRDTAHGKPALRYRPHADATASTASRPNVRDEGHRPSLKDETARLIVLICPTG